MEYNKEKKEIILDKELNNLDIFALKFLNIVSSYVDYVVIAGYVSILLGRTRTTEDIDVFIKRITKETFFKMYQDLENKGFWCLNTDNMERAFDYLETHHAIRFAKDGYSIPNFEVKFPKDKLDEDAFEDSINVILPKGNIIISCLERNIAFKRYFLKSDKDNEDASHLEELFHDKLDYGKINKIRELIILRGL